MARLKDLYKNEVVSAMMEKFKYKSIMEVPRLEKVVVNMGIGDAKENPKFLESAVEDLAVITGQKPIVTKARKSVAAFKLREGMNVGAKVTLRGERMYEFLDRLLKWPCPGETSLSDKSFDEEGTMHWESKNS